MRTTTQNSYGTVTYKPDSGEHQNLEGLLLRAIEHERLSASVYRVALDCVTDATLRATWTERLRRTQRNVTIATTLCNELSIEIRQDFADCMMVRKLNAALIAAMAAARCEGFPKRMERIARECVGIAESNSQLDWDRFLESIVHTTPSTDARMDAPGGVA